ncbi:MAG: mreC [Thermoleophilia bacterium]|nr:mreC [Thermoleophilia bacterium]
MRPTLPRPIRRRRPADSSRFAKGSRSVAAPTGGPVAPTAEYVGRRGRRVAGGARSSSGNVFPRRRPSAPVRRSAFAALIFASIALISATYRGGVVLHGAQLAVLDVVAPIERGMSRAWDPIAGAWNWSGRLLHATDENPRLKQDNEELRAALRLAQKDADEAVTLRREMNFDARYVFPDGYEHNKVHARVIVQATGAAQGTLTIDRGSDDGIRVDDTVMVTSGLIGRITEVTPSNAVVGLITDPQQQVGVKVSGSEASGVLQTTSTEGSPAMHIDGVKQSAKVEKGDIVVTGGFRPNGRLKSIYPEGVLVGEVTSFANPPAELEQTVQVKPYADFDRIDRVLVLVPDSRGGDAG